MRFGEHSTIFKWRPRRIPTAVSPPPGEHKAAGSGTCQCAALRAFLTAFAARHLAQLQQLKDAWMERLSKGRAN